MGAAMRRLGPAVLLVGLALMAAGCTLPAAKPPLKAGQLVGSQEVVLVGKVELLPPLAEGHKDLDGTVPRWYEDEFRNTVHLLMDERWRVIEGEPGRSDFKGRIAAPIGEFFVVRAPRRDMYLLEGFLVLPGSGPGGDRIYLPGGLHIPVESGDRALYMGTLRYHRNEFFDIEKVELINQIDAASTALRQRTDSHLDLEPAKVELVEASE